MVHVAARTLKVVYVEPVLPSAIVTSTATVSTISTVDPVESRVYQIVVGGNYLVGCGGRAIRGGDRCSLLP